MTTESAIKALAADAAAQGASDIHLDLDSDAVRIRLRVDGRLRAWVPVRLQPERLRDAAWEVVGAGADRLFDWRVATHADGERLALRLRAERTGTTPSALAALGMTGTQAATASACLDRPGGLFVVAGLDGSGRRATIGALLEHDVRNVSVVSIGLAVPHALSLEARADAPMDHAIERALALDPDVLVLGDLPDRESAARAFRIAGSVCRVIVRLRSPDAMGAIDRLRGLGVERLALASQLRAVTAQRLVNRLCPTCRHPLQADNAVAALLGFDPGVVIFESNGCGDCAGSGVAGRLGVFEVVAVDAAVARILNDGGDAALLARHVFLNAPRLDSAARAMVRDGTIAAGEAVRVSKPVR